MRRSAGGLRPEKLNVTPPRFPDADKHWGKYFPIPAEIPIIVCFPIMIGRRI